MLSNGALRHHALFLVSAFEWTREERARLLQRDGWVDTSLDRDRSAWVVDQFVPAYREAMYFSRDQGVHQRRRTLSDRAFGSACLGPYGKPSGPGEVRSAEVWLFPDGLGVYALELDLGPSATMDGLSSVGAAMRSFDAVVSWTNHPQGTVARFIEEEILGGIKIRGSGASIDEYSGPKLKAFVVADVVGATEPAAQTALLYDIGCFVPPGAARGENAFAPTSAYFSRITEPAVAVFRNWSALGLYDAFVCVGDGQLGAGRDAPNAMPWTSWTQTYFRLFVFNVYLKFAAQRMSADIHASAVEDRARNERFLVEAEIHRISYGFLPNLLHTAIRQGLELDHDLGTLRGRIARLSKIIDEQHKRRSSLLLGLVSMLSGLNAYQARLARLGDASEAMHIHRMVFWSIASVLTIAGAIAGLAFVAPQRVESMRRRWRRWRNRRR